MEEVCLGNLVAKINQFFQLLIVWQTQYLELKRMVRFLGACRRSNKEANLKAAVIDKILCLEYHLHPIVEGCLVKKIQVKVFSEKQT